MPYRIVSPVAGLDLLTSDCQAALSCIERHVCLVETADDGGTVDIRCNSPRLVFAEHLRRRSPFRLFLIIEIAKSFWPVPSFTT